jgi:MFS family permease
VVLEQAPTIVLLGVVGIGNAPIDVGGFTLLARLADETVLARMFAGCEAIVTLGLAAGGFVTPLVVELLGVRPALAATGLLAPLAVAASWPALRRLDAEVRVRDADIETMRPIRMLGALPVATIEQLAGALEHAGSSRYRAAPSRAGNQGSVTGSDTTRAPEAQHVRQAAASYVECPPEPPEPAGIRHRR